MRLHALLLTVGVLWGAGCHSAPPATPAPEVSPPASAPASAPAHVALRAGWSASLSYQRRDSIILALPSGERQVQQMSRSARFSLTVGGQSAITVRLDSLTFAPAVVGTASAAGTTWTGQLVGSRVGELATQRADEMTGDLTEAVGRLFPRLPAGGVTAGMRWRDSATVRRQLDIFSAIEDRHGEWEAGSPVTRKGIQVIPVTLHETLELRGQGSQAGRAMSMTAQGVRSTTYYLTIDGRLDGMTERDSSAILVSIPDAHQVVPTVRIGRVEVVVEK